MIAALVLLLVAGCTAEGGGSADGPGGSAGSAAAGGTTTAPVEGGPDGTVARVVEQQVEPAPSGCDLRPGAPDLSDLTDGSTPAPAPGAPAAGVVPVPLPGRPEAVDQQGDWFLVGGVGLVQLDPVTAAPVSSFVAVGGCRLSSAATSDDHVAALACADAVQSRSAEGACTIVAVSLADGATVGRWATPETDTGFGLGIEGAMLTVTTGPWVRRFDAATGQGLRTLVSRCVDGEEPTLTAVIARTHLVEGHCSSTDLLVVDADDGEHVLLAPLDAGAPTFQSDGTEVWAVGRDRYDADTFERIAPPLVDDTMLEQVGEDGWIVLPGDPVEVPGALWLRRCRDDCAPGAVAVEVARLDLGTGQITDRWEVVGTKEAPSRSVVRPLDVGEVVAADADGAWIRTDDQLGRIERSR